MQNDADGNLPAWVEIPSGSSCFSFAATAQPDESQEMIDRDVGEESNGILVSRQDCATLT